MAILIIENDQNLALSIFEGKTDAGYLFQRVVALEMDIRLEAYKFLTKPRETTPNASKILQTVPS